MTIINQTGTLTATGGGTVNATPQNSSWVKMNDTRMVFVYNQTSPAARRFMIVDNLDGLNSTTTPSFTSGIVPINDTTETAYYSAVMVKLVKVNENAFACIWKSTGPNKSLQFEIFTITGSTITRVAATNYEVFGYANQSTPATIQGTTIINGLTNDSIGYRKFQQPIGVIQESNNVLLFSFMRDLRYLSRGNQYQHYQAVLTVRLTFNPTNNAMTFSYLNAYNFPGSGRADTYLSLYVDGGISVTFNYPDFYDTTSADGTSRLAFRILNRTTTLVDRTSGVISQSHRSTVTNTWYQMANKYDICFLDTDRRVEADWNSGYCYNSQDQRKDGGAIFTPPPSPLGADTSPYALPLTPDYFMLLDSAYFYNSALPLRMKVICREDFNIMSPSIASQSQYGITINPPVKIDLCWDKTRPFIHNQDVMWCGIRQGTTNTFSYNIIKQPT